MGFSSWITVEIKHWFLNAENPESRSSLILKSRHLNAKILNSHEIKRLNPDVPKKVLLPIIYKINKILNLYLFIIWYRGSINCIWVWWSYWKKCQSSLIFYININLPKFCWSCLTELTNFVNFVIPK